MVNYVEIGWLTLKKLAIPLRYSLVFSAVSIAAQYVINYTLLTQNDILRVTDFRIKSNHIELLEELEKRLGALTILSARTLDRLNAFEREYVSHWIDGLITGPEKHVSRAEFERLRENYASRWNSGDKYVDRQSFQALASDYNARWDSGDKYVTRSLFEDLKSQYETHWKTEPQGEYLTRSNFDLFRENYEKRWADEPDGTYVSTDNFDKQTNKISNDISQTNKLVGEQTQTIISNNGELGANLTRYFEQELKKYFDEVYTLIKETNAKVDRLDRDYNQHWNRSDQKYVDQDTFNNFRNDYNRHWSSDSKGQYVSASLFTNKMDRIISLLEVPLVTRLNREVFAIDFPACQTGKWDGLFCEYDPFGIGPIDCNEALAERTKCEKPRFVGF